MLDAAFARTFAEHWLAAWNAHDLNAVLAHYAPGFTMASPFIAAMGISATGRLTGHEAVRAYWTAALGRMPDLAFTPLCVLAGADSLVIHYRTSFGKLAAETFFFDDNGLVIKAAAHYAD